MMEKKSAKEVWEAMKQGSDFASTKKAQFHNACLTYLESNLKRASDIDQIITELWSKAEKMSLGTLITSNEYEREICDAFGAIIKDLKLSFETTRKVNRYVVNQIQVIAKTAYMPQYPNAEAYKLGLTLQKKSQ
jgi:hypothetical protein